MTTENTSAVGQLFRDVKSYIATKKTGTSVLFGRKEHWIQINQGKGGANRIVFIPGKLEDGSDGELAGVDGPGAHLNEGVATARALHLQAKIVTISIWVADTSNDPSASVDELAQYEAHEQMFEWIQRAVRRSPAGAANVAWKTPRFVWKPEERRFGNEYIVEIEVGTQYFDDEPGVEQASGVSVGRDLITS